VRAGAIGAPKTLSADVTLRITEADDVRLQRRLGGGTVYDLGVSCINTARTLFGAEPAQVMAMTARTTRPSGGDVDESAVALVRFPDERLAHFHTSFGEELAAVFTIFGEEGYLRLTGADESATPMTLQIVRHAERQELQFEPTDAVAGELASFSRCILHDQPPEPSGLEGFHDIRIVEAIYRSGRDGRPVTLPRIARRDSPTTGPARPAPAARRAASGGRGGVSNGRPRGVPRS
jgi:predicted dehydrogenase